VTSRLERLPEATKGLLRLATCIGNQFDLGVLARASGTSLQRAAESLWPALLEGLVLPVTEDYATTVGAGAIDDEGGDAGATRRALDARVERAVADGDLRVVYRFLHDRVQQAAYALIPPEERK